jgi:hypothetical protein
MNNDDRIAFSAHLSGSTVTSDNDWGIWSGPKDSVSLVARLGDIAPETGGRRFTTMTEPIINGKGEILFYGSVGYLPAEVPVGHNYADGLWLVDALGEIHRIAMTKTLFEVGPGDLRTISLLSFPGGSGNQQDGLPLVLNDAGQILFRAAFSDGSSGIFLASVPEPSMVLPGLTGVMFLAGARLRARVGVKVAR